MALLQQAIVHLSQSHRIWRVIQQFATYRQKYHAGASTLIKRTTVRAGTLSIPKVTTNLSVVGVDVGEITLFLLPDMILYLQGKTFANIPYETFSVKQGTTRFIEDDPVPGDALVVGQTWRYVNKNGGPDRRFNNNRQLPVAQYGVLELVSSGGLNIHLNTSSAEKAASFANCMSERLGRNRTGRTTAPPPSLPSDIGPRAKALKVLGLSGSPSAEELSRGLSKSGANVPSRQGRRLSSRVSRIGRPPNERDQRRLCITQRLVWARQQFRSVHSSHLMCERFLR